MCKIKIYKVWKRFQIYLINFPILGKIRQREKEGGGARERENGRWEEGEEEKWGKRRERKGEREKEGGQRREKRGGRENLQEIYDLLDVKKVSVCKCNRFNNIEGVWV